MSREKILGDCHYDEEGRLMGWIPEKKVYQEFESEEEYWDLIIRPKLEDDED